MTRTPIVWKALLAVSVATAATACASTSAIRQAPAPDAERVEGSSSDMITVAELRRLDPGLSLMDVVEHARPWFLHPRGSVSTVSIDNGPPAELAVLRTIPVAQVREIRLLRAAGKSGPAAIRPAGTVTVGDVILVVTGAARP